jgi:hypothetical protein
MTAILTPGTWSVAIRADSVVKEAGWPSMINAGGMSLTTCSMCRSTAGSLSVAAGALELTEAADRKAASAGAGPKDIFVSPGRSCLFIDYPRRE